MARIAAARARTLNIELIDTGIFDDNRYFDIQIEYAKASVDDILIRIAVTNRGPDHAVPAPAADALVSQHLGLEAEDPPRPSMKRSGDTTIDIDEEIAGLLSAHAGQRAADAVHRKRDPMRARCGAWKTIRLT